MTSRNFVVKLTSQFPRLSQLVTNLGPLYRNYVTSLQSPFKKASDYCLQKQV